MDWSCRGTKYILTHQLNKFNIQLKLLVSKSVIGYDWYIKHTNKYNFGPLLQYKRHNKPITNYSTIQDFGPLGAPNDKITENNETNGKIDRSL